MDKSAKVVAITGEHIVLEGDTINIELDLSLVEDDPETDPYNTSTVKVLRPGTRKC